MSENFVVQITEYLYCGPSRKNPQIVGCYDDVINYIKVECIQAFELYYYKRGLLILKALRQSISDCVGLEDLKYLVDKLTSAEKDIPIIIEWEYWQECNKPFDISLLEESYS